MRLGRAADHSPPSSAADMEEKSYTSTHPLGHTGPVTASLYLYLFYILVVYVVLHCMFLTLKKMAVAHFLGTSFLIKYRKGHTK